MHRSFLSRERTVAPPGFPRWLVPPAAIAVHMCIGQVYGFSVFNKPLAAELAVPISNVQWAYQIALMMLGISAAVFGKWVERSGPRKTMLASCLCFCGGLLISALAVKIKSIPLLLFGYGFVGGIGLGLGYISPVSTLVKWFPDRPGMATGMAIMGFGGGALIGSPLGQELMKHFASGSDTGAMMTFVTMAGLYSLSMVFGAFLIRVPADNWKPDGYVPSTHNNAMITTANVAVDTAWKTPQYAVEAARIHCLKKLLCFNPIRLPSDTEQIITKVPAQEKWLLCHIADLTAKCWQVPIGDIDAVDFNMAKSRSI
jgi:MFS family permease